MFLLRLLFFPKPLWSSLMISSDNCRRLAVLPNVSRIEGCFFGSYLVLSRLVALGSSSKSSKSSNLLLFCFVVGPIDLFLGLGVLSCLSRRSSGSSSIKSSKFVLFFGGVLAGACFGTDLTSFLVSFLSEVSLTSCF